MKTLSFPLVGLAAVTLFAAVAGADPVFYGAYVNASINNENCSRYGDGGPFTGFENDANCNFNGTDPRFFTPHIHSLEDPPHGPVPYDAHSSAFASHSDANQYVAGSASLASGDLSVRLLSSAAASYSSVAAAMWDTVTFDFNDNATHLVTVSMSGCAQRTPGGGCSDPPVNFPHMFYRLDMFQPPDPVLYPQTLSMGAGVVSLSGGPYSASASMLVSDGMSVVVFAGLSIAGSGGTDAFVFDPLMFSVDGSPFTLDVGSFTSESGVLLTESASEVPEPATLVLLGTGLAAAYVHLRRTAALR